MDQILDLLTRGDNLELILLIVAAILVKNKWVSERLVAKIKYYLKQEKLDPEIITNKVKATITKVRDVREEVREDKGIYRDTQKKKISRVIRKIRRGWFGF